MSTNKPQKEHLEDTGKPIKKGNHNGWITLLLVILAPFVLVFGVKTFVADNYYVPSASMEPTLMTGDRIMITLLEKDKPNRGDVIVFEDTQGWLTGDATAEKELHLVKRVMATEGDTIACCDPSGRVLVNGTPVDEGSYVQGSTTPFETVTVPKGTVWVMGDNREGSADSRAHIEDGTAFIPVKNIKGKVWFTYWPLNQFRIVE